MSTNAQFSSNAARDYPDTVPPSSNRASTVVSKPVPEREPCGATLRVSSNDASHDRDGGKICAELRAILEQAEWDVAPSSCHPTARPSAKPTLHVPCSSSQGLRIAPPPQTGIAELLRDFVLEHE
jgi:hypothetical protein